VIHYNDKNHGITMINITIIGNTCLGFTKNTISLHHAIKENTDLYNVYLYIHYSINTHELRKKNIVVHRY
jgi:hypothetical protein